ncbi:MAG: glycoside hydrolase family 25 protein [Butyrivibrio sp.]|nr:glycoside hydrolase family 25 protein [Butyrivibrio sp.]
MKKSKASDYRYVRGLRNTHNIISIIFLSLVSILALSFSIVLLIRNATLQRQEEAVQSELDALNAEGYFTTTETQKLVETAKKEAEETTKSSIRSMIQKKLESGDSTISAIRALFPEQMVVASSGRYYFFPILDAIKRHGFSDTDFELDEKGFIKYVGEDKSLTFRNGVDVSRFQGDIDWARVAGAGIDFAIVRAGLRGTTEGKVLADDCFEDNVEGALKNGIDVGVYFYSQAINEAEAKEEAQMMLDMIEPYEIKYPVVIDVESADSENARTNNLTTDQYEAVVRTFLETVRNAGYTPMIYGNVKTYTLLVDAIDVDDYDIWIAYYGIPMYYPYHFDIWQYSSTGTVPGIEGNVDLNICLTDYTAKN